MVAVVVCLVPRVREYSIAFIRYPSNLLTGPHNWKIGLNPLSPNSDQHQISPRRISVFYYTYRS